MTREFTMKKPEQSTMDRIKEVQFYLIIKQLKQHKPNSLYLDNVIENLALLYNCKITSIHYAITNLENSLNRPTALELGLAHKYADIPVRTVCSLAKIASKTLYDALEKYVYEGSPDLTPRFSSETVLNIENFNRGIAKSFELMSHLGRKGHIYD